MKTLQYTVKTVSASFTPLSVEAKPYTVQREGGPCVKKGVKMVNICVFHFTIRGGEASDRYGFSAAEGNPGSSLEGKVPEGVGSAE